MKLYAIFLSLLLVAGAEAQTTEFTYQGSLKDGANAANGSYDFEFLLFDALAGGSPQGPTVTRNGVAVSNGIFAVTLDFGDQFPGAARFLEIRTRVAGGGAFTPLSPRQPISSTPYAVKSVTSDTATTAANALQLGGVAANQYVITTDPRMSDAREPTAGSASYIQNQNAGAQAASNFNISGTGTANIFRAGTQYNIGANRVLSNAGTGNLFAGVDAGSVSTGGGNSFFGSSSGRANTTATSNSFFGSFSGFANTTGFDNSFFGRDSGFANTTSNSNSFFGSSSGKNTTGGANSFFGAAAGIVNTIGGNNSFFGTTSGASNTTGFSNSFFGTTSGASNTTGFSNSFFGRDSGFANTTGFDNSFFGRLSGFRNTTGTDNSFFGSESGYTNTTGFGNSFFGGFSGRANTTGSFNSFSGSFSGLENTTGTDNSFFGSDSGRTNTTGVHNSFFGSFAGDENTTGNNNTAIGYRARNSVQNLNFATAIGSNAIATASNHVQIGRIAVDTVAIGAFATPATSTAVCVNAQGVFVSCSASSLRYKDNVRPFRAGLNLVSRLQPVAFSWKDDGGNEIGLVAEEVAAIDPILSVSDSAGKVDGVKYTQLTLVLINAVNEQQAMIEVQAAEIKRQKEDIDALRALVCIGNKMAPVCRK